MNAGSVASLLAALAFLPSELTGQGRTGERRWSGFDGLELGDYVDELLARDAECRSPLAAEGSNPLATPTQIADLAFGRILPHGHQIEPAARAVLGDALWCGLRIWDGRGGAMALAFDRTIVAIMIHFNWPGLSPTAIDTILTRARSEWGPGEVVKARVLVQWWGERYRAFFLVPQYTPVENAVQLVLYDVRACSAFERRIHRAGERGPPAAC